MEKFAEVILPLPLPGTFTYSILPHQQGSIRQGSRVIVMLGNRKIYTGIVHSFHDRTPDGYQPKEILEVLDNEPVFTNRQITYFEWMARYYMCTLGEVIQAALPTGLKISSESYISVNPEIDLEELDLTEKERMIVRHLSSGEMKIEEISKLLNIRSSHHHIKNLAQKSAILVFEKLKDKYTPRTVSKVRLTPHFSEKDHIETLFAELEKKPRQLDVLLTYLKQVPVLDQPTANEKGIGKKELLSGDVSASSLKTLLKNGIFEEWQQVVPRIGFTENEELQLPRLSEEQERAREEIIGQFQQLDTVLLKGITGSGKTELYISLIHDIVQSGGQVLYLLPEIALTTQIIKRLARVFGDSFGIYHSRYSDNERVEVWQKVLNGQYRFVVGVRSSVFLPFSDLSLIIVDEEHETSYKQYEPAPRYNARDAAIYLAASFGAKTLLGTATPSLESYYNALNGKYGLVRLDRRYGDVSKPGIAFADLTRERKRKTIKGNFSALLLEKTEAALDKGQQVIIFQNRRGYAPYLTCDHCGHIPKCPNCDVSLTYHHFQHFLICHYCGFRTGMPAECPECGSPQIKTISYGTEKLEEELEILLPHAKVSRMDLDSTRSKYSYQRIIDDFEEGNTDILVGTQMVSKGLDFDNVTLVGIFDTDRMIHFPDFRSHERAFQLIHQVSGRAGRKMHPGEVVIQTNDPSQPLLRHILNQDYEAFYQSEILERERFHYPPFYRIIKVTVKDKDKKTAHDAAQFYAHEISRELGTQRIFGPVEPLVGRIRNLYLYEITIKLEKQGLNIRAIKEFLLTSRNMLISQRSYKSVRVIFDVDPL